MMSNNSNSDHHAIERERQSAEFKTNPANGRISRRTAVGGLLGAVGVVGSWPTVAASPQSQPGCQAGPDFAVALQQSQLDFTNQGLVINPTKGIVATFGNSFYRFDTATSTYSLCRNGVEILRGKFKSEIQGAKNVFIEEIEAPGATTGAKAIRLFHVVEVIDRTPLRAQVSLDAGVVGEATTFWFSAVYDVNARAFSGFMIKGTAPIFDLTPFRPLGRLIRNTFGSLFLPPIVKGPAPPLEPPPPDPDTLRCFDCQVSAMVFCDLGSRSDGHNSGCVPVIKQCGDCLGDFPLLRFGF